jgi:hypothetical protein
MSEAAPSEPESSALVKADSIKRAVEKYNSKKPAERDWARAELDRLGADKFEVLIALLQKESAGRRRRRRYLAIGLAVYLTVVALAVIVPLVLGHRPPTGLLSPLGNLSALIVAMYAVSAAQKNATRALSEFNDKRAVGWWAAALEYNDKEIVSEARSKLVLLLPQLTSSDSHLLDGEQRAALYKALAANPDRSGGKTDLHLATLRALQHTGDEKVLHTVEELARGRGAATKYPELAAVAQSSLPALRERVERSRDSQILLRAASGDGLLSESSDLLLRPASGAEDGGDQELLRAAAADSEPLEPSWPVEMAPQTVADPEIEGEPARLSSQR